ncbi:MAG: hypothetical protein AABZ19_12520 [Pseudomonadota bacterium]
MWIVAIAWIYVALMMALAEATSPQGTYLGAVITFVFYGVAPTALVMYLLSTPGRRRARRQAEAEAHARQSVDAVSSASATSHGATSPEATLTPEPTAGSAQADASGLAAGAPVASVGKEAGSV